VCQHRICAENILATRPIFDTLQAQHHLQRHRDISRVGADRGLIELGRDVLPSRFLAGCFRQVADQRSHIGDRSGDGECLANKVYAAAPIKKPLKKGATK
jgi:hypothetical protein